MQESEWVGLIDHVAVMPRNDVILVKGSLSDRGDEALPNAGTSNRMQRVRKFVPSVKAANYRDGARIRRPDTEVRSGLTVDRN